MSHSEFLQSRVSAHGPWIQDRTSDFNPKLKPVMHFEAASQPAELPPLTRRACASPGAGLCNGPLRCAASQELLQVNALRGVKTKEPDAVGRQTAAVATAAEGLAGGRDNPEANAIRKLELIRRGF